METMTKDQMVQFLRGMNAKKQFLSDEKKRLKGSIESLEEAISRNSFARSNDNLGTASGSVNTDKVLHVLLNSRRDIEEETRNCVIRMHDIYAAEDQIDYVCRCLYRLDGQDQYLINEVYVKDVIMDQLTNILNMSRSNKERISYMGYEPDSYTYELKSPQGQSICNIDGYEPGDRLLACKLRPMTWLVALAGKLYRVKNGEKKLIEGDYYHRNSRLRPMKNYVKWMKGE